MNVMEKFPLVSVIKCISSNIKWRLSCLDMYEDVYGHSVEEYDLCVSPTTGKVKASGV